MRQYPQRWIVFLYELYGSLKLKSYQKKYKNAVAINQQVLSDIVANNQLTEFGVDHRFASLVNRKTTTKNSNSKAEIIDRFQQSVPLGDYPYYESYVDRIADGEQNILCHEEIIALCSTTGTTSGKPRLIPYTKAHLKYKAYFSGILLGSYLLKIFPHTRSGFTGINLLRTAGEPTYTKGGLPIAAGTSLGQRMIKRLSPMMWAMPKEVTSIQDQFACSYVIALFALKNQHATYIISAFNSQMVGWFNLLENNWASLLDDIRAGSINESLNLSSEERCIIEQALLPDESRYQALSKILDDHGLQQKAKKIWPKLCYVGCVSSGSFDIHKSALTRYLGDEVPVYSHLYGSTEAFFGINLNRDQTNRYTLIVGRTYFEFIPLKDVDNEQPKTCQLDELEVGGQYELVVTNNAGLYRYRVGDVIKVVGFDQQAPIYEFSFRRNIKIDLVSEKTNERILDDSVQQAVNHCFGSADYLLNYTAYVDTTLTPHAYGFYIELSDNTLYSDVENAQSLLADALDYCLGKNNPYYQTGGRALNAIGRPVVNLVEANTFQRVSDHLVVLNPEKVNQLKSCRVTYDEELLTLYKENHLKSAS